MSEKLDTNLEKMAEFFDLRADGYDDHMKGVIDSFETFYELVSKPVRESQSKVSILDLGCGTGLELEGVFKRAPYAEVTGIDMSQGMLEKLLEKYKEKKEQIKLIKGSYLDVPFGEQVYDYVISVMTMHHLTYLEKLNLYKKIWSSLKEGGIYIEGDFIESPENERKVLKEYLELLKVDKSISKSATHFDIPFSIETEGRVIIEAGFSSFEVIWHEGAAAVYMCRK